VKTSEKVIAGAGIGAALALALVGLGELLRKVASDPTTPPAPPAPTPEPVVTTVNLAPQHTYLVTISGLDPSLAAMASPPVVQGLLGTTGIVGTVQAVKSPAAGVLEVTLLSTGAAQTVSLSKLFAGVGTATVKDIT
jgi:hypothetical protein